SASRPVNVKYEAHSPALLPLARTIDRVHHRFRVRELSVQRMDRSCPGSTRAHECEARNGRKARPSSYEADRKSCCASLTKRSCGDGFGLPSPAQPDTD